MRQQKPLGEYPTEMVTFECGREGCTRRARYRKDRLIAQHGPEIGLNTLLLTLQPKDCPHLAPDPWGNNTCRMHYGPELLEACRAQIDDLRGR